MKTRITLSIWVLAICVSCTPVLDADFDAVPLGQLANQAVDLPGPPTGDRMIIDGHGNLVAIDDSAGNGDHTLLIYRKILTTGIHSEVYLDPIPMSSDGPIYFSWDGTIEDLPTNDNDAPVIALKLSDVQNGQPNIFSKLIIRYGPEKITAALLQEDEVSIGNGVFGRHNVILRIDPETNRFAFLIGGDGVSPAGGFTYNGTLSPEATINPENIGVTITFADEINNGVTFYRINNALISQWEPDS